MENATYIALSKQAVLKRQMSVIAHNIANMNTSGYKAERMVFREYIDSPTPNHSISFVQDIGLARDLTEGPTVTTGNPLDVAISGPGYFTVDTPNGDRFTRHGRFQLNPAGQIITSDGSPILSNNGAPIIVPPGSGQLTIASDGAITGKDGLIGRVGLVEFENEQNLKRAENGLYDPGNEQPQPATRSEVVQGNLENSNVQAILEMTRMIDVHRAYTSVQNFMRTEHQRALRTINTLGRPRQG